MKKVLIVFDGPHFSQAAFDMACHLNASQPILLTGIFLPSIDYTNTITYYLGLAAPVYIPMIDEEEDMINENIKKFRAVCEKNNVKYRIHTSVNGTTIEGIKKETRYSDVLILSSSLFYSNLGDYSQRQYLHDTAHNAECPVILIPENYRFPKSIVLAYDGSESSLFAIRQYAYLFPELRSLKTLLIYASVKNQEIPDLDYIKEYASQHFPNLSFLKLDIDPKEYLDTWIKDVGPSMLVAGAYGRSLVSEVFRKSFVSEVVSDHSIPVFIAHK